PIGCAVDFVCRLIHLEIILPKKSLRTALCNKALSNYQNSSSQSDLISGRILPSSKLYHYFDNLILYT
ncbi:hypothetical protein ENC21_14395, partial [Acinetobacter indicus]